MRRIAGFGTFVAATMVITSGAAAAASPTWKVLSTPNPSDASGLFAVSCVSATACTAVGDYGNGSSAVLVTEALRWNGSRWTIESTPNPGSYNELNAVSCPTTTACFGVGDYQTATSQVTLAEHWNGKGWVNQPIPTPSPAFNTRLTSVSCVASTSCIAVGAYENSANAFVMLAERWNGSVWMIVATPSPAGASDAALDGVACTSSTACVAVGGYTNSSNSTVPLADRWNGKGWTLQTIPPSGTGSEMTAVSCTSAAACVAVGSMLQGSPDREFNIGAVWNGTSWSLRTMPDPAGARSTIAAAVSCTATAGCVAVGDYKKGSGVIRTFADAWDGATWTSESAVSPTGAFISELFGVSCPTSTVCFAAGDAQFSSKEVNLIERRS